MIRFAIVSSVGTIHKAPLITGFLEYFGWQDPNPHNLEVVGNCQPFAGLRFRELEIP
jgi:hypothetical protein